MKPGLLLSFVIVQGALAASDPPAVPVARLRLTDEMIRRVENVAPVSAQPNAAPAADNGVVVMAPVLVKDSYLPTLGSHDKQSPKNVPFSWTDGGTIWKGEGSRATTELKFQYNPLHKGFDILSISR